VLVFATLLRACGSLCERGVGQTNSLVERTALILAATESREGALECSPFGPQRDARRSKSDFYSFAAGWVE
jgi:hypothetical protein